MHLSCTNTNFLVTSVLGNLISVRLAMVFLSMQDRCMVCAKRSQVQKLFWTNPRVLLGDKAQLEAYFHPFGDNANLDTR
jgi:hypothetical protein